MPVAPQSYPNHKKYVVGYHGVAAVLLLVLLIWSVRLVIVEPTLGSLIPLITVIVLVLIYWYTRAFALTVQNRVIRLEEQLRMSRLLPDDLRGRIGELRMGQFISLRFASDRELPGLVRRVLAGEFATPDAIKRAITEWRADHDRA